MDFIVGLILLLVTFAPACWAGAEVARRTGSRETPATMAVLVASLIGVGLPILLASVVGAAGGFRPAIVAAVCGAVGLASGLAARHWLGAPVQRSGADTQRGVAAWVAADSSALPAWCAPVSLMVLAIVVGVWTAAAVVTVHHGGTFDFDSLNYHLVFSGDFVRSGWTTRLSAISFDPTPSFNPANGELVDAMVMAAVHSDLLVPFVNLGWLALGVLAAWAVGARRGLAPLTLCAGLLVLCTPLLVVSDAGTAGTDLAALALVVTAFALLLDDPRRPSAQLLSGFAAGLAVGTKFTVVVAAVIVALALVYLAQRSTRLRSLARWLGAAGVAGCFWYLRNWFRTGSPVPSLHLGIGPWHLPSPKLPLLNLFGNSTMAQYLLDGSQWHRTFVPGLHLFGRAWPVVLAAAAVALLAGLVVSVRRRDLPLTVLSVGGGCLLLAYTVTPNTAYGPHGAPYVFVFASNLRYATPGLFIVLLAGAMATGALRRRWRSVVLAIVAALPVATASSHQSRPPTTVSGVSGFVVGAALTVLVGLAVSLRPDRLPGWASPRRARGAMAGVAVAALVAVAIGGAIVTPRYLRRWYRSGPSADLAQLAAVARTGGTHRIGVLDFGELYPLVGPHASNEVRWIGEPEPHGGIGLIRSCTDLRRVVSTQQLDMVVVPADQVSSIEQLPGLGGFATPQAAAWLRHDPAVTDVVRAGSLVLFRLDPAVAPTPCTSDPT